MINDSWIKYLHENYLDKNELALDCGTNEEFIDKAIAAHAFPQPSYLLKGQFTVQSHINSVSEVRSVETSYFPKSSKKWLLLVLELSKKNDLSAVSYEIKQSFETQYLSELSGKGVTDKTEQEEMLNNTWKHFLLGTYGVCVIDTSEVSNIVSKQFAAMDLTKLTDNGKKTKFEEDEREKVELAISEYNKFTTSFGPWEYKKTSRKRLVDDVMKKIESV